MNIKNSIKNTIAKELKYSLKSQKISSTHDYFDLAQYVGGGQSRLKYLNAKIPHLRSLIKEIEKTKNKNELLLEMSEIWFSSDVFEEMCIPLFWLENQTDEFLVQNIKKIIFWARRIDNWAHSDTYSGILARVFEIQPQVLLKTYQTWNRHKNEWYRRISIVGLVYYSRMRKQHPPFSFMIKMIEPHMRADEYYLQKAVGWGLRETYNIYPKQTLAYLRKRAELIPPAGWTAATEKLSKTDKAQLTQIRKAKRSKNKNA